MESAAEKLVNDKWRRLVLKHTHGGACNFQAAAAELADLVKAAELDQCQKVCRSMSFEFNAGSRERDALQRAAARFDMPEFRA